MVHWRLLRVFSDDVLMNMALEEAITREVGKQHSPSTLRLWVNPPSVIVGRNQIVDSEVNLSACRRFKIEIVRRFSGGGTVYHDKANLNCTLYTHRRDSIVQSGSFYKLYHYRKKNTPTNDYAFTS